MSPQDFAQRVRGVAALADPVRRALYEHVAGQPEPVSREQAARAVRVPLHNARFHLDRLVEEGLLAAEFRRLTGRSGPGAGRPAKLYRRADAEVSVTLPPRRYDLAGELMAQAIERSAEQGAPVIEALRDAAAERGRAVAERNGPAAAERHGPAVAERDRPAVRTPSDVVRAICDALAAHGYQPRPDGAEITLGNCPFHALVREHRDLVCTMNLALLSGLGDGLADGAVRARLDAAGGRCCVVLTVGGAERTAPSGADG